MTHLTRTLLALGTALALPVSAALAQTDPGFENGSAPAGGFGIYNVGSTFGGWTVGAGSIDLINGYWMSHSGNQSVDMNGTYGYGTIYQDIATTAGQRYNLSFWMAGNQAFTKTMDVYFGSTLAGSYTWTGDGAYSYSNMEWQQNSASGLLATSGMTRLSFVSTTYDACACQGAALDDVAVVTATPEPMSVALLGSGLLGLGGVTLRRRRATA